MDSSQLARRQRIEQFELDVPGVRLRFSDRLARENGWSGVFARRVIAEYKRFCILAVEAGHPVTPSEHVDQAWHLHLVYTRSYWEDFCPNCLGRPLHHGPTKGGEAEGRKHADWYEQTLASYRRLFGEAPPADIWPSAAERFDRDLAWRRVNWRENWVVPKQRVRSWLKYSAAGLALVAVVGCAENDANPLDWKGPEFLAFYVLAGLLLVLWNFLARGMVNSGPTPPDADPELTDYEIAYLQGDRSGVFHTSTVKLTQQGHLLLHEASERLTPGMKLAGTADPIDRDVVSVYARQPDPAKAQNEFKLPLDDMHQKLTDAGLLITPGKQSLIRWLTTAPFVLLFVLGLAKIVVGVGRGKSVGFLIGFSVVCLLVSLIVMVIVPRLSGFGKRHLRDLQARYNSLRKDKSRFTADYDGIALPVALFGAGILIGSPFNGLGKILHPPSSSSGDSGGSSGGCSGGDGGGGGCGGCGGGGD